MFHMTTPEELPAFFASVSRAMRLCNNGAAEEGEGEEEVLVVTSR